MLTTRIALLCVALLVSGSLVTAEEDPTPVMIVLDASGSMWGQIEGKPKIEIARKVIQDLLRNWDSDRPVGLMAYGHRRKADCEDIETLLPAARGQAAAIVRAMDKLNPKGKTPLSEAVRRAASGLGSSERPAAVVLISDGKETCGLDPCEVGAVLAMGGVDFTAHVIGFGVNKLEQAGLRCLAENTGGLFLTAEDARTLKGALTRTVRRLEQPARPVVEEPGEASVEAPASVPGGSMFEVSWTGPDSRGDYITIVAPDAPEGSYLSYAYTSRGSPLVLTAPLDAGPYQVRYVFGHTRATLARTPVTVTPVTAGVRPPPEVMAGARLEVIWKGPSNRGDYITIVKAGSPEGSYLGYAYTGNGNPAVFEAPVDSGAHEVRYISGQAGKTMATAPILVKTADAAVRPPDEVAVGARLEVIWKGPDNKGDFVTIVKPGAPKGAYLKYAYTRNGNPAVFEAPMDPGPHEVRYLTGQGYKTLAAAPVLVKSVATTVASAGEVKAGARLEVIWKGPDNKGDFITIVSQGAPEGTYLKYAYTKNGNPAMVEVPMDPGPHEVRYLSGQGYRTLASAPVTVKTVNVRLSPPAKVVAGTTFEVIWTGPDNKGDFITIVKKGAPEGSYKAYAYTTNGNPAGLEAPDDPGPHEVRYLSGQGYRTLGRAPITVTPR